MSILALPCLHLTLGPVNKLWKCLEEKVGMQLMNNLAKNLNIVKDEYQGKTFEGKACKTILGNTDIMRVYFEVFEKEEYLPFIDTLEAFEQVVETCFGYTYHDNYEEKIDNFEKKWMELNENFNVSIPNKCHIIFTHVKEFIFVKKVPLGQFSEQSLETCHQKWIQLWNRSYKVRNLESELYGERLLACLLQFNAWNI